MLKVQSRGRGEEAGRERQRKDKLEKGVGGDTPGCERRLLKFVPPCPLSPLAGWIRFRRLCDLPDVEWGLCGTHSDSKIILYSDILSKCALALTFEHLC